MCRADFQCNFSPRLADRSWLCSDLCSHTYQPQSSDLSSRIMALHPHLRPAIRLQWFTRTGAYALLPVYIQTAFYVLDTKTNFPRVQVVELIVLLERLKASSNCWINNICSFDQHRHEPKPRGQTLC
uniref:Uncharacterized protein n=1 Tax=Triticum urartu TaxID=4572 RepID=A0A8R7R7Z9_TRIUA